MPSMVVCPEPLAADVGIRILRKGGNAVDAAVAASFAQGVVNPQLCGIGGSAEAQVYTPGAEGTKFVACGARSGSKMPVGGFEVITGSNPKVVKGGTNEVGYKSMTVPTFVRDVGKLHETWGSMDWKELLDPAIRLCEEGFTVYPYISNFFNNVGVKHLSTNEACARIYLKDGRPYRTGEKLVQSDYGATLRKIAKNGPSEMFKGEVAEAMIGDIEKNDGYVTRNDISSMAAEVYDSVQSTYHDYTLCENLPPTSGPLKLLIFNILENFDLDSMGWNSPAYLQVMSRAIQLAWKERRDYLDLDPKYSGKVIDDMKVLLEKGHARELSRLVTKEPLPLHPSYDKLGLAYVRSPNDETTYLGVADSKGMAVSMKHSIGNSAGVVTPGLGFMYNNHLITVSNNDLLPSLRDRVRPGHALGSIGEDPALWLYNGKPFLIGGSPGGMVGAVGWVQVACNITHFGMNPQEAVSVPRIEADGRDRVIMVESSFPYPYPVEDLKRMGNVIEVSDYVGRESVIRVDPRSGELSGGADPRGGGGLAYDQG